MVFFGAEFRFPPAGAAPARNPIPEELGIHGGEARRARRQLILRPDRLHRADEDAQRAIHAFVGLNIVHPATLVDAVDGADLGARAVLHVDAGFRDYIGHVGPPDPGSASRPDRRALFPKGEHTLVRVPAFERGDQGRQAGIASLGQPHM